MTTRRSSVTGRTPNSNSLGTQQPPRPRRPRGHVWPRRISAPANGRCQNVRYSPQHTPLVGRVRLARASAAAGASRLSSLFSAGACSAEHACRRPLIATQKSRQPSMAGSRTRGVQENGGTTLGLSPGLACPPSDRIARPHSASPASCFDERRPLSFLSLCAQEPNTVHEFVRSRSAGGKASTLMPKTRYSSAALLLASSLRRIRLGPHGLGPHGLFRRHRLTAPSRAAMKAILPTARASTLFSDPYNDESWQPGGGHAAQWPARRRTILAATAPTSARGFGRRDRVRTDLLPVGVWSARLQGVRHDHVARVRRQLGASATTRVPSGPGISAEDAVARCTAKCPDLDFESNRAQRRLQLVRVDVVKLGGPAQLPSAARDFLLLPKRDVWHRWPAP